MSAASGVVAAKGEGRNNTADVEISSEQMFLELVCWEAHHWNGTNAGPEELHSVF